MLCVRTSSVDYDEERRRKGAPVAVDGGISVRAIPRFGGGGMFEEALARPASACSWIRPAWARSRTAALCSAAQARGLLAGERNDL
ncbi:MAG: hypothetical protein BGO98_46185 [Myxococcales bacterium 68-20]|nr:hypothetical protein [Myxococcales bacterium]OJY31253.1 MAG: hypothetical protein BGO98_46185 [Myxococcales bacterium 68-20]